MAFSPEPSLLRDQCNRCTNTWSCSHQVLTFISWYLSGWLCFVGAERSTMYFLQSRYFPAPKKRKYPGNTLTTCGTESSCNANSQLWLEAMLPCSVPPVLLCQRNGLLLTFSIRGKLELGQFHVLVWHGADPTPVCFWQSPIGVRFDLALTQQYAVVLL